MTIYEQIPDIVTAAVQSLYRTNYVENNALSTARVFDFFQTNATVGDITLILSQLGIVVSVFFVGLIVFIRLQKSMLKPAAFSIAPTVSAGTPELVSRAGALRQRWDTVVAHLNSTKEYEWKVAVMEADKLVDDALANAGFPGATFGDRLSNIQPGTLVSLDGIWWAHKIRNRLAHEVDYFLRYTEAKQAVGYFEAALSELQLI